MRTSTTRGAAALLAATLLAVTLLGGCAKPGRSGAAAPDRPGPTAPGALAATGSGGASTPAGSGAPAPTSTGAPAGGTPGAAGAETDAKRLLAAFVPPLGAVRLGGVPAALASTDWALSTPGVDQMAEAQGWWQVRGDPAAVLAAIRAAPPIGSTVQSTASSRGSGVVTATEAVTFAWPDDGLLRYRQLQVATAKLGPDTVIRVDVLVAYADPKPVAAVIGPEAKIAVVVLLPRTAGGVAGNRAIDPPEPLNVTDPAQVAKLAAIINAAPPDVSGVRHCPMMTAARTGMTIVFATKSGAPALVTVFINTNGCQNITVTPAGAARGTVLIGGVDQINQIIDLLGVRWPKQG